MLVYCLYCGLNIKRRGGSSSLLQTQENSRQNERRMKCEVNQYFCRQVLKRNQRKSRLIIKRVKKKEGENDINDIVCLSRIFYTTLVNSEIVEGYRIGYI